MLRPTVVLLALLGQGLNAEASDFKNVAKQVGKAVVTIETRDALDHPVGLGSGFFLPDGRIVTNAHVLEGAKLAIVRQFSGQVVLRTEIAERLDLENDLAVLPAVSAFPGSIELALNEAEIGAPVLAFGAPEGLANTVSSGIVSAIRELGGRKLLQISAPVSPGSSGGPVVDDAGKLVGVTVSQLSSGQNLNFAISLTALRALLQQPQEDRRLVDIRSTLSAGAEKPWLPILAPDSSESFQLDGGEARLFNLAGVSGEAVEISIKSVPRAIQASAYLSMTDDGLPWYAGSARTASEMIWTVPLLSGRWASLGVRNPAPPGQSVSVSVSAKQLLPSRYVRVPIDPTSEFDELLLDKASFLLTASRSVSFQVTRRSTAVTGRDLVLLAYTNCTDESIVVSELRAGAPEQRLEAKRNTGWGMVSLLACDYASARGILK